MGYPIDLDEYPESKLHEELERRAKARREGLCDYCGRPPTTSACKFPERHARGFAPDPRLSGMNLNPRDQGPGGLLDPNN